MTNSDYTQSRNFSLCYDCGLNEHRKTECSICHSKTSSEMHRRRLTMRCVTCSNFSHLACSRVNLEDLEKIRVETNLPIVEAAYNCFDCLIGRRPINYLIMESCLHYQYIHNLV